MVSLLWSLKLNSLTRIQIWVLDLGFRVWAFGLGLGPFCQGSELGRWGLGCAGVGFWALRLLWRYLDPGIVSTAGA